MNNKALKILFFYNGLFVLAASLLGPLYALFVESYVDGVLAVSYSWAAFLISTTVFTVLVARLGDRVKEKEYFILAGFVLRATGWLLFIFVGALYQLILVQIIIGAGEALGTPGFNSVFADHLDNNMHVKEYSIWSLISNIASAIGVIIGGYIIKYFGFNVLFLIMTTLAIVSFFGILLKPRKLL